MVAPQFHLCGREQRVLINGPGNYAVERDPELGFPGKNSLRRNVMKSKFFRLLMLAGVFVFVGDAEIAQSRKWTPEGLLG